ncbi:MAG: 1,4-alpha-glucan branching enzyme, partial [Rubrobacteraceae bacterium]
MIHDETLRAIASGDHPDPFSVLGMHEEDGEFVVRTFLPGDARRVQAVSVGGYSLGDLAPVNSDGLFAGIVSASEVVPYRLRVVWDDATVAEVEDPYRFPPTLGEMDLHLFGEGNHHRLYDKLGAHISEVDGVGGTAFAVWAPNARRVSVVGDFNGWEGRR